MSPRRLLLVLLSLLAACPSPPCAARAPRVVVDVLIRRGKVVDGSGRRPRVLDVGIRGDRIVFVGDAARRGISAARTIQAAGLVVAPGFIDPHTHTLEDLSSPARRANENYLMQGVTTVFTGNDGGGPVRVAETLEAWRRGGIGTNAALLVGHGTVRQQVLGMSDAAPTPGQLARMKELVARAMDEGAFGMSTGLYYAPGSFAKTEEVIELSRVVAARGGVYDTHMRDEDSYSIGLLGSIEETIRIGREAHIPVHISHIKALGTEVWGQSRRAVRLIERARRQGVRVTADQYPYTASGTGLTAALVPRWAEAGGGDELLAQGAQAVVVDHLLDRVVVEDRLLHRDRDVVLHLERQRLLQLVGRQPRQVHLADDDLLVRDADDDLLAGEPGGGPQLADRGGDGLDRLVEGLGVARLGDLLERADA